jgi:hypothetical protein
MLGHGRVFDYGWGFFLTALDEAVKATQATGDGGEAT